MKLDIIGGIIAILILIGVSYGLGTVRDVVEPVGGYDLTDFRNSERRVDEQRVDDGGIWRRLLAMPVPTPRPDPTPISTPREEVNRYNEQGNTVHVWLTYYTCPPFCGAMRNGEIVYEGAVACGGYFAMGQKIRIENDPTFRTYVCADTGYGGWYWVDIFFSDGSEGNAFISLVGSYVVVELVD